MRFVLKWAQQCHGLVVLVRKIDVLVTSRILHYLRVKVHETILANSISKSLMMSIASLR